jgi:pimeloyl-ACP methyl ester carboxylesterase
VELWGECGPLVLAVHGMTSSRRSWERLARHLEGRFRVAAYDQRGHGESAAITGPMSLERGVRDAENVAAALGEPIDVLLGHSWGGAVAILAGTRLASRIATVDPMLRQVSDEWYAEYLDELRELFALTGSDRDAKVREEFAAWSPLDVEGKVHAVHAMTILPIERLMKENPPEAWDLRSTIACYQKPLLLALATPGEGINDDAVLADVERTASSNVRIVAFPGAGHNLHRTAFESFAAALDDWLAQTQR